MDFKYTVHAKADAFVLCVYFCKRMHMTIFSLKHPWIDVDQTKLMW